MTYIGSRLRVYNLKWLCHSCGLLVPKTMPLFSKNQARFDPTWSTSVSNPECPPVDIIYIYQTHGIDLIHCVECSVIIRTALFREHTLKNALFLKHFQLYVLIKFKEKVLLCSNLSLITEVINHPSFFYLTKGLLNHATKGKSTY